MPGVLSTISFADKALRPGALVLEPSTIWY